MYLALKQFVLVINLIFFDSLHHNAFAISRFVNKGTSEIMTSYMRPDLVQTLLVLAIVASLNKL